MPPERDEPDIPEPDDPDDPDIPELEDPDDPLRPLWPLWPLWPLIPERLVSPASSSEADDERLLPDALRELPSPAEASSRIPLCDDELD